MARERVLLVLSAEGAGDPELLPLARRRGFHRFAATGSVTPSPSATEEWWRLDDRGFHRIVPPDPADAASVPIREVTSPAELQRVIADSQRGLPVAVRWSGERILPLESLVAGRGRDAAVWVIARDVSHLPGYLGALERGADTVAVEVRGAPDIEAVERAIEAPRQGVTPELVTVARIAPVGIGDRVIVDTTSLLSPREGLWVGSSAAFLFHVASEAVGSRYTRPRPFRVNAGAAHSYVLLASGETRYLSELEPGEALLCGPPEGPMRSVRVGRLKIERRPMTLVEATRDSRRFTVFLQEAETVRLSSESGPVAVTELVAGQRVYGAPFAPGRHLGQAVEETVEER